ncbi:MAG: exonuclease [Firmicutes bacterium]|nr:exonuclease [Bacillota bacterium]
MRITFYDGCDRIGGNKLLLEADGASILLDFGTSFAGERLYFDEFLTPRATHGIGDLLELGLLPPLRGIYREDLEMAGSGMWERAGRSPGFRDGVRVDGLLLTHGHVDHTGYASYLSESIPVFTTCATAVISKAMQDVAQSGLGREVCYVIPREPRGGLLSSGNSRKCPARQRQFFFLDRVPRGEDFGDFWRRTGSTRQLEWREPETRLEIGGLNVRFWPVDHSIPGACAFGIETSEGLVIYTGDLRLHGRGGAMTRRFISEAAALKPLALVTEGTHTSPVDPVSEDEVYGNALTAVRESRGLVIADFGPRNVERLLTFLRIAHDCGRRLAVTAKDAYLLRALNFAGEPGVPDLLADERIAVYQETKAVKAAWERELLESCPSAGAKKIDCGDVSRDPSHYILCFSYYDLNELIDIQPEGGSYIYSSSEAFNEEMHMDLDKLRNWVNRFGMRLVGDPGSRDGTGKERGFHASGHINGKGIIELVEEISPRFVIPVHTEQPEFFRANFGRTHRTIIPAPGSTVTLP